MDLDRRQRDDRLDDLELGDRADPRRHRASRSRCRRAPGVAEFPDVPTLQELGYRSLVTPGTACRARPGLPPEITSKLNRAVIEVLAKPDVRRRLLADAIVPEPMSPEQFAAFVATDIAKWGPIAKQLGMGH